MVISVWTEVFRLNNPKKVQLIPSWSSSRKRSSYSWRSQLQAVSRQPTNDQLSTLTSRWKSTHSRFWRCAPVYAEKDDCRRSRSDSTKQSSQLDSRQKKLNESLAARRKRPMVRKVVGPAPSSSDSSTDEEAETHQRRQKPITDETKLECFTFKQSKVVKTVSSLL